MDYKFNVEFLEDAREFIDKLPRKDREKILYNIWKSRAVNDPELFKKLTNTIWEFRTLFNGKHYRLFAFWTKRNGVETIVICTHGIIKKTSKTPDKEIVKADKLRNDYLKNM
jgi:phage-related protein